MNQRHTFLVVTLIFAMSGFAGLIYESVWTHYLKLFLGHAAYAQVLVLAIFMGGLAIGSWLASRYGKNIRHLLLAYALMEALIGILGLVFHQVFTNLVALSYDSIIPGLDSSSSIIIFKWTLSAALILPQSILLGTTFPLMTAGIIRRFPKLTGFSLATLYFANSIGAAIGILVSGFILIEHFGLPGTIATAGILNFLVAFAIWLLVGDQADPKPNRITLKPTKNLSPVQLSILIAAFITGAASFLYEVAWIRMLSLVLGSSTHAFELMLGAFILGLALGGLIIRSRIDRITRPVLVLGLIQIGMGCMALLTLSFYDQTFSIMQFIVHGVAKSEAGYQLFNLFSNGIALVIMLPTTILAGMTLPLMTNYLFIKKSGEKAIGQVYAANTFGAIVGVVLGLGLLMPVFGIKSLIVSGGVADILLGALFLFYAATQSEWKWNTKRHITPVSVVSIFLVFSIFFVQLDPIRMASGVFLQGEIKTTRELIFHADGRAATIDVVQNGVYRAIITNGKVDAAIAEGLLSKDEPTMVLSAALPLTMYPQAQKVAVIGMGSGLTTHTALGSPNIERIDTIEIEPKMVEGAKFFGERVERAFSDPRSFIHIEDAKAFFTHQSSQYDIIISEPSNPWVSGVSGLFSKEFYQHTSRHLADDGLFVQWLHIYSLDVELISSVMKAISENFGDYAIYALNDSDLAIVATKADTLPPLTSEVFKMSLLKQDLSYIGIHHLDDFRHRKIGSMKSLLPYFDSFPLRANSDYYPVLDLGAVKARFLGKDALELHRMRLLDAPLLEVLEQRQPRNTPTKLSINHHLYTATSARQAIAFYQHWSEIATTIQADSDTLHLLRSIRSFSLQCDAPVINITGISTLHQLSELTLPWLSAPEATAIWKSLKDIPCIELLSSEFQSWLSLYNSVAERDYATMLNISQKMLGNNSIEATARNNYLLTLALLAAIQQKQSQHGVNLWHRYENKNTKIVELRVLRSYLFKHQK